MRPIDAEPLERKMNERYEHLAAKNGEYDHYVTGYEDALCEVEEAPTIEAVPVVRCKNCMFSRTFMTGNMYCELHQNYEYPVSQDDYCSRGEKMDLEG